MMTPLTPEPGRTATEGVLVARARKGDAEAFRTLFDGQGAAAWRLAFAVTGDVDLAATAVVAAFARAIRELPARMEEAGRFLAELLAITREAAIGTADAERPVAAAGDDPLSSAFWRLPERWRSMLWVTRAEGLPLADAALVLGISLRGAPLLAERAAAALSEGFPGIPAAGADRDAWRKLSPPLPHDLGPAAEERWRGATSRRARLVAAATAGSPSPELRQRLTIATAGVLGLGILGTIVVSPHLPNIGGHDIPVAEAGNGFKFNDPLSRYRVRPGEDPSRDGSGAEVALISLVTSTDFPNTIDPVAPLFDTGAGAGREVASGPLPANPGAGTPAAGPAVTTLPAPGAPGGPPLGEPAVGLPDPGSNPTIPPPAGPVTTPTLPLPTTTVPGTPPLTAPPVISTPGSPQPTLPPTTLTPTTLPSTTLPPPTLPPTTRLTTTLPPPTLPPPTLAPVTVTTTALTAPATTVAPAPSTLSQGTVTSTVTTATTVVQTVGTTVTTLATTVSTAVTTPPLTTVSTLPPPPRVI